MKGYRLATCCELLLLLATQLLPACGFVVAPCRAASCCKNVARFAEVSDDGEFDPKKIFPVAEYEDFSLYPHRPLGMTIEESLSDSRFILVTKVVEGGNAGKAGLAVGDVLVGISGLFGELTNAVGLEVEKIKGFVGSRPEDEALLIKVARGTEAHELHEKAVIELCSIESSDKEIEQCVVEYLATDYNELDKMPNEVEECDVDNPDEDCLLDSMMDMWNDDLPPPPPPKEAMPEVNKPAAVKPWSSRSSPSGTYVRDPATGEMKNIG